MKTSLKEINSYTRQLDITIPWDLIEKDYFRRGSTIIAIHTGGFQGIEGMNQQIKNKRTFKKTSGRLSPPSHHTPREFHDAVRGPPPSL